MTAIAGVKKDGKVWIGGDSAGVGGMSLQIRSDPKVFVNGEFVIGYTSSFRMGQLLQYEFSPPRPYEGENGMRYMVTRFVPEVKTVLKNGGFQIQRESQDVGGQFLVGYRGELYDIEDDYQVARVEQGFCACGCGQDLVLGSLFSTEGSKRDPDDRIRLALKAAEQFSAGVRAPFHVLHTEGSTDA